MGIDALQAEGVTWGKDGELTATFLYARRGAGGRRRAINFLNGQKVEKTITLPTERVTAENAEKILKDKGM